MVNRVKKRGFSAIFPSPLYAFPLEKYGQSLAVRAWHVPVFTEVDFNLKYQLYKAQDCVLHVGYTGSDIKMTGVTGSTGLKNIKGFYTLSRWISC